MEGVKDLALSLADVDVDCGGPTMNQTSEYPHVNRKPQRQPWGLRSSKSLAWHLLACYARMARLFSYVLISSVHTVMFELLLTLGHLHVDCPQISLVILTNA